LFTRILAMKKFFLFLFLNAFCLSVVASDYQVIIPSQDNFFHVVSSAGAPNNSWYNSLTWSPIKVASFDSSASIAGGTEYYSFHTWRDTSTLPGRLDCMYEKGPCWLGEKVFMLNNGSGYFYNSAGDTFHIQSNSALHDFWTFYHAADGSTVLALLDSMSWMQRDGVWDSVRCISLHAFDAAGFNDPNSPMERANILLSKSNGFFQVPAFRELPEAVFMLERRASITMPKINEIYDFNPGDEFEYEAMCANFFGQASSPGYTYYKILSKSYSANLDTVIYYRQKIAMTLSYNAVPVPHFDTIYFSGNDWVSYPVSGQLLFDTKPEENFYSLNPRNISTYSLSQDYNTYNNRPVYKTIKGFTGYSNTSNCYVVNHFEPVFYTTQYAPGLGEVFYEADLRNVASSDCRTSLIWYNKGGQVWGGFVSLTAGIPDALSESSINVSPNPVLDFCNLNFPNSFSGKIILSDLSGRILAEKNLNGNSVELDLREFSKGIYLLHVFGANGFLNKKIIKE